MNYAFIQARMNSSRLQGKVLYPLCNKMVLDHVYTRVNRAKLVDKVFVLTGIDSSNNPIVQHCIDHGYNYYLGEDENVLKRYSDLMSIVCKNRDDKVIRITADCPLIDPYIIDEMLLNMKGQYYTNQKTYIDGYDVEIMTAQRLAEMSLMYGPDEHVTLKYKTANPEIVNHHEAIKDLHNIHLSLDTEDDFNKIRGIYEALHWANSNFGYNDVVRYLAL